MRAATPAVATRGLIGEYAVAYDGKKELRVEASLTARARALEVEPSAEEFISDVEASPDGATWKKATREGQTFVVPSCAAGPCRLRYRFALREAAKRIDELETASEEGAVIIAPPATWLLTPPRDDDKAKVRFRVTTAGGTSFATGVYRSTEAPDAWDITLADLWSSPYSAFGPLRMRAHADPPFQIAFGPGKLTLTDDEVVAWADTSVRALAGYLGTFPMKDWLLVIIVGGGRAMGEGKTLSGGGGTVFLRVGEGATMRSVARDWVLTHEITHLTFPTLARPHHWAEEGIATYIEPFARARIGTLAVEEAWKGVIEGVPNGLPGTNDQGLDHTQTWGRTYWGGALFFLAADIAIRKRTGNKLGLEHAMRAINRAGGNNGVRWSIAETFAVGDKGTGVPVLTELYAKMAQAPGTVDLASLWKDLGVVYMNGKVTFDDSAPSAAIRKAMTTAN